MLIKADQKKPDHIQVYVSDDGHSINNIYKDMNITSEQTFTIPFKLSKKWTYKNIAKW